MALDVESYVNAKLVDVNNIITQALSASATAMKTLEEIANISPGYVQMDPDPLILDPISIDAIKPDSPDLQPLIDGIMDSNIEDVQIKDIALSVETLPAYITDWLPDPIVYNEGVYQSDLLDSLKAKLLYDVENGGTGLSATIEQDIMDRNIERDAQVWRDARDKVLSQWATAGFSLPDNVLTAQIQELVSKEANAYTDRSRDIRIESYKMATENTRFAIQQGIVLESELMKHFNQVWERTLKFLLGQAETGMRIYLGLIEAYKAQNEIALMDMKVQTDLERLKIEQLQAKVAKYKADADVFMIKMKALTDKYGVDMTGYNAELGKEEALARVTVSQQQMIVQRYLAVMNTGFEAARSNMNSFVAMTEVRERTATAMGNIYANYLGSAINSLNGIVQASATEAKSGSI